MLGPKKVALVVVQEGWLPFHSCVQRRKKLNSFSAPPPSISLLSSKGMRRGG